MKILIFILSAMSMVISNNIDNRYSNKLLFCLKSSVDPLTISKNNNSIVTNVKILDILLNQYSAIDLEQWLTGVTEDDYDKEIYLNRIYRLVINNNNQGKLLDLKEKLENPSDEKVSSKKPNIFWLFVGSAVTLLIGLVVYSI